MMPLGQGVPDEFKLGTREHAERLTEGRHPGVQAALQWLAFSHLPEELAVYARPFYQTAAELLIEIPTDSPELTTTLNTIVEAKDWAVRAGIRAKHGRPGPVARPSTVVNPPLFGEDQTDGR
jgi:hypothetical protein